MGDTHMAGLVLARGGSKGIPLKNIAPLGCKPLVAWCLQSMQEFGKFDSIWVSTDHQAIAECAQACGAKKTRERHRHCNQYQRRPGVHRVTEGSGRGLPDSVHVAIHTAGFPRDWLQDGPAGL